MSAFKLGKRECYNIHIRCKETDCGSELAWNCVRPWAVTAVKFESSEMGLVFLELLPVC